VSSRVEEPYRCHPESVRCAQNRLREGPCWAEFEPWASKSLTALGMTALLVLSGLACVSPPPLTPPWKLPPDLENGSRVRVVAQRLGQEWFPGRVQLSTDGCWTVEVAETHDPEAITILAPGELTRMQVSQAIPRPNWWEVPEDEEGWNELVPHYLEDANAPTCKRGRRSG
jgi:hypothetical protein